MPGILFFVEKGGTGLLNGRSIRIPLMSGVRLALGVGNEARELRVRRGDIADVDMLWKKDKVYLYALYVCCGGHGGGSRWRWKERLRMKWKEGGE